MREKLDPQAIFDAIGTGDLDDSLALIVLSARTRAYQIFHATSDTDPLAAIDRAMDQAEANAPYREDPPRKPEGEVKEEGHAL